MPLVDSCFSLSLSQRSPLFYGVNFFTFVAVFLLHLFYHFFGVGLPAHLSNQNPFSREHIFVGFKEFPYLVYWCTVIHHHRSQGPTLFRRVRWVFTCVQCDVYTDTGPPVLSPIREDQVMYSKSLTQGDCSRMSAGSGNRTSAPVQALDHKSNSLPLRHCA